MKADLSFPGNKNSIPVVINMLAVVMMETTRMRMSTRMRMMMMMMVMMMMMMMMVMTIGRARYRVTSEQCRGFWVTGEW